MAVKLHRCTGTFIKGPHPCWQVQKALQDAGVEYELVLHPAFPRSRRTDYIALTGQKLLPAIELDDGRVIRESSAELAKRVREGTLGG